MLNPLGVSAAGTRNRRRAEVVWVAIPVAAAATSCLAPGVRYSVRVAESESESECRQALSQTGCCRRQALLRPAVWCAWVETL